MNREDALALLDVLRMNQVHPPPDIEPERLIQALLEVVDREHGDQPW